MSHYIQSNTNESVATSASRIYLRYLLQICNSIQRSLLVRHGANSSNVTIGAVPNALSDLRIHVVLLAITV